MWNRAKDVIGVPSLEYHKFRSDKERTQLPISLEPTHTHSSLWDSPSLGQFLSNEESCYCKNCHHRNKARTDDVSLKDWCLYPRSPLPKILCQVVWVLWMNSFWLLDDVEIVSWYYYAFHRHPRYLIGITSLILRFPCNLSWHESFTKYNNWCDFIVDPRCLT